MKKYLVCLLLLAACGTASAQKTWSVKAGMNFSNWSNPLDTHPLTGFKIGAGAELPLAGRLGLQPSLFFSAKGCQALVPTPKGDAKTSYRQFYLELPVNAQVRFPLGGLHALCLAGGPYFALGVGGTSQTTLAGKPLEGTPDTFGREGLRRFDFGLGVGAGYEYSVFLFAVEYQFGLTKLGYGRQENELLRDPRNANLSIVVGYRF